MCVRVCVRACVRACMRACASAHLRANLPECGCPDGYGKARLTAYPSGRVEIYKAGQGWGTLCGHYFWDNQNGAAVICKQLGYAQGGVWFSVAPGAASQPIVAGNRECVGDETTVFECPLAWAGRRLDATSCDHSHDQGVSCAGARSVCDSDETCLAEGRVATHRTSNSKLKTQNKPLCIQPITRSI